MISQYLNKVKVLDNSQTDNFYINIYDLTFIYISSSDSLNYGFKLN